MKVDLGTGGSDEAEDALVHVDEVPVALAQARGQDILLVLIIAILPLQLLGEVHVWRVWGSWRAALVELSVRVRVARIGVVASIRRQSSPQRLRQGWLGDGEAEPVVMVVVVLLLLDWMVRLRLGRSRGLGRVRRRVRGIRLLLLRLHCFRGVHVFPGYLTRQPSSATCRYLSGRQAGNHVRLDNRCKAVQVVCLSPYYERNSVFRIDIDTAIDMVD